MTDGIIICVLVLILGLAVYAIRRAKKSGKKCIGCPYSGNCQGCGCKKEPDL